MSLDPNPKYLIKCICATHDLPFIYTAATAACTKVALGDLVVVVFSCCMPAKSHIYIQSGCACMQVG